MFRIHLFMLSFMVLISLSALAQEGNLYAVVDGNNVTIWQTAVQRNCGASYIMGIELNDHYMKWWQHDYGEMFVCLCYFDLAVSYGPLEPGEYNVDVYYTTADIPGVIYGGSTSFTIENSRETQDSIVSGYQSTCGTGIKEDSQSRNNILSVYPNPVRPGEVIHVNIADIQGDARLEICSSDGRIIYHKNFQAFTNFQQFLVPSDVLCNQGIYFLRLITSENSCGRKIIVR